MKKWTPKQIKILKDYWLKVREIQDRYWWDITTLEMELSDKLKIECEIFHCEHDACGIGSLNREMELVQREKLES